MTSSGCECSDEAAEEGADGDAPAFPAVLGAALLAGAAMVLGVLCAVDGGAAGQMVGQKTGAESISDLETRVSHGQEAQSGLLYGSQNRVSSSMLGGGEEGGEVGVQRLDVRKHCDCLGQRRGVAGAKSVEGADKRLALQRAKAAGAFQCFWVAGEDRSLPQKAVCVAVLCAESLRGWFLAADEGSWPISDEISDEKA